MKPIPDSRGKGRSPPRFHRQGQAIYGFLGKIILIRGSLIFFRNLTCGGGLQKKTPETGNWHSHSQTNEDYENKERIRKIAGGQQMGKEPALAAKTARPSYSAGSIPTVYIACMDCRGHHLFQGTLQVPLPYSLFSRGIGNHSVHTEVSGLLKRKSDDMEHAGIYHYGIRGAVRERAALLYPSGRNDTERKGNGRENTDGKPRTTGQSWQTLLVGRQVRPASGFGKIISLRSGIFPENPAFPESI